MISHITHDNALLLHNKFLCTFQNHLLLTTRAYTDHQSHTHTLTLHALTHTHTHSLHTPITHTHTVNHHTPSHTHSQTDMTIILPRFIPQDDSTKRIIATRLTPPPTHKHTSLKATRLDPISLAILCKPHTLTIFPFQTLSSIYKRHAVYNPLTCSRTSKNALLDFPRPQKPSQFPNNK